MNKKAYIQPTTKMTVLAMQQMICTSDPKMTTETTNDVDDLLSRELHPRSLWDDNEEE